MHLVGVDVDAVDRRFDEVDAVVQLAAARADDVLGVGQPERHEQQTGLVDVAVVLVDDGDLHLVGAARRRSRLATSVPPVPPPRITTC